MRKEEGKGKERRALGLGMGHAPGSLVGAQFASPRSVQPESSAEPLSTSPAPMPELAAVSLSLRRSTTTSAVVRKCRP